MTVIGFLHTSPVHVPTFDRLVAELGPGTTIAAVVETELLARARESGGDDRRVAEGVERALDRLADDGAEIVVCTCSTIGGVAERVGRRRGQVVLRVDRPMAERAVDLGPRIHVLATLDSTLGPTRDLIAAVAADRHRRVEIETSIVEGAWPLFEAGDLAGCLGLIADRLGAIGDRCDVVVLAQASMAGAAELVDTVVPVLSSPRLAVEWVLGRR
jgi:hypothetical protein